MLRTEHQDPRAAASVKPFEHVDSARPGLGTAPCIAVLRTTVLQRSCHAHAAVRSLRLAGKDAWVRVGHRVGRCSVATDVNPARHDVVLLSPNVDCSDVRAAASNRRGSAFGRPSRCSRGTPHHNDARYCVGGISVSSLPTRSPSIFSMTLRTSWCVRCDSSVMSSAIWLVATSATGIVSLSTP